MKAIRCQRCKRLYIEGAEHDCFPRPFYNQTILITGGTGSWGTELTRQLLKSEPAEIRILARNEYQQVTMHRKFNDPRLKIVIADIRDYEAVDRACKGVDLVFHLSALKHVPICEEFPYEAIKTNIQGTKNLINASIANNVKKVVDVSSDKAVMPINLYGMTKAIGEKLILHASTLKSGTKFMVVRGGNVVGTNGSVIPFWIDQIERFNKVTITDNEMTRYFLTLPEAIKLLFTAVESDMNGSIFVMRMPSCKIRDLAEVLIEHYTHENVTDIEEIGMRPGEKLDEVLISKHETPNTFEYDKNYYVIVPKITKTVLARFNYKEPLNSVLSEYNSCQRLMDKKEIKELLRKAGYLK